MEPSLILFDVDGTLVDTGGVGRRAFIETFGRLFARDGVEEAARGVRFQGKTDPIIIAEIVSNLGMGADEFSRQSDRFWTVYVEILHGLLQMPDPRRRALPGVRAVLDDLERRSAVYLGLLTGNIEAGARAKLASLDLDRYFPEGGFASDHPERRVIARMAREKLSRLHGIDFPVSGTVVVGDTEHDVDCARANHYRAVAVNSGWVPREELEAARPDSLLEDFTDLGAVVEALALA